MVNYFQHDDLHQNPGPVNSEGSRRTDYGFSLRASPALGLQARDLIRPELSLRELSYAVGDAATEAVRAVAPAVIALALSSAGFAQQKMSVDEFKSALAAGAKRELPPET